MANKKRRRRKSATACPGAGQKHTHAATTINDLTDDLLEDVLLRVRSPVCLVRAAAACRPWRRAIGGDAFLRRFRSRHGPHLLGHFVPKKPWKVAKFVPAASPPGTPPIDISESIDLGVVHDSAHGEWVLTDSRDGLLAFVDVSDSTFLVYDPLTYEHMEAVLPPRTGGEAHSCCFGAFLLDADADEDTGSTSSHMSRFRVLCVRLVKDFGNERYVAISYVFSAKDRQWIKLSTTDAAGNVVLARPLLAQLHQVHAHLVGRVAGSIFWSAGEDGNVLELDETTGEFSVFTLPPPARAYNRHRLRVFAGDARTLRLVRIVGSELEVITRERGGVACAVYRSYCIGCLIDGHIWDTNYLKLSWEFWDTALEVGPGGILISANCSLMFSLNVETMKMKGMDISSKDVHLRMFPYEPPWPPTFRACLP